MKASIKRLFTIAIAFASFCNLSSCDDDAPPGKTPLLIGKTWTIISYEIDGGDATEECLTDNTMTFFPDATFVENIGLIECEEDELNTEGSWKFKANETILSILPVGEAEQDWEIRELTESKLTIYQYVQLLDSEVVVIMSANN